MNMSRKSIKKRTTLIFFPMLVFITTITFCIIFSMASYNKTLKFYTDEYYITTNYVVKLNEFMKSVDNYNTLKADVSYNTLVAYYEKELVPTSDELYSARFNFDKSSRLEIEGAYDIVKSSISSNIILLPKNHETAYKSLLENAAVAYNKINKVVGTEIKKGNAKYNSKKITIYVCEGLMVAMVLAFIGVAVYVIFFIKRRISKPIADISEWAKLFKDEYTDMTELKHDCNDEIGDLVEAFNIVKEKLVEVKTLRKENEVTIRKLKEEEEYKKKFVKQLYDEKREKETISSEAKRDGLTGLYNRRSFDALIDEFIGNKPVAMEGALFLIDMDNFKNVNDTLGHLAGDEALKTLAGAMRIVFPGGYLGRYGGDEFIAFVTGISSDEELESLGKALCTKMDRMFEKDGKSVHLSVSIGAVNTVGIDEYAELYMKADKALYYSKEHGRNQYTLASQIEM